MVSSWSHGATTVASRRLRGAFVEPPEIRQIMTSPLNSFKGLLQASVTVRKCGVITKYTEISVDGNPLKLYLEPIVKGDTYQFTAALLHNEAMASSIAG